MITKILDSRVPAPAAPTALSGALAYKPARTGAARIERIQILRALAACMVVVFHIISNYLPKDSPLQQYGLFALLAGGVDIFFMISGFIIRTTTYRTYGPDSVVDYLKKRFARVVPYYWLITAMVVALSLAAPQAFHSYQFEARHVLASFFFIPWPRLDGTIYPPLVPGWSLNFEILFYAVFAVLMVAVPRQRTVLWLAALFGTAVVVAAVLGVNPQLFIAGNPYVLEFVAGAAIADIWRARNGELPKVIGWLALPIGLGLLLWSLRDTSPGVSFAQIAGTACCFVGFLTMPAPVVPKGFSRWLSTLGEASYSIYLVHPIVLSLLSVLLAKGKILNSSSLLVPVMAAIAIGSGWLAWRFVEQPLLALSRRWLNLVN
jgi:exopolysaccharide production protein ExoZ